MKLNRNSLSILAATMVAITLVSGCKKQPEAVVAPVAATPDVPANPGTPAAPVQAQQVQADALPAQLAESQAAINARDYEKAANTLVSLQNTRLTEQQAAAVAAQMRQFQGNLATAVASGDPRAKAAADRLRQASKH